MTDRPLPEHDFSNVRAVLFVCLGNICRSPLGEALFVHHAQQRGVADRFRVDSCGLGDWHAGELADPRTRRVARKHGLELTHRARQIRPATDFDQFDLIVPMDASVHHATLMLGSPKERTILMRRFEPTFQGDPHDPHDPLEALDVPDPYTGAEADFEHVHEVVDRCCKRLLETLLNATPKR